MELIDGINTRRSYRAFKGTPIPPEVMDRVPVEGRKISVLMESDGRPI